MRPVNRLLKLKRSQSLLFPHLIIARFPTYSSQQVTLPLVWRTKLATWERVMLIPRFPYNPCGLHPFLLLPPINASGVNRPSLHLHWQDHNLAALPAYLLWPLISFPAAHLSTTPSGVCKVYTNAPYTQSQFYCSSASYFAVTSYCILYLLSMFNHLSYWFAFAYQLFCVYPYSKTWQKGLAFLVLSTTSGAVNPS